MHIIYIYIYIYILTNSYIGNPIGSPVLVQFKALLNTINRGLTNLTFSSSSNKDDIASMAGIDLCLLRNMKMFWSPGRHITFGRSCHEQIFIIFISFLKTPLHLKLPWEVWEHIFRFWNRGQFI